MKNNPEKIDRKKARNFETVDFDFFLIIFFSSFFFQVFFSSFFLDQKNVVKLSEILVSLNTLHVPTRVLCMPCHVTGGLINLETSKTLHPGSRIQGRDHVPGTRSGT